MSTRNIKDAKDSKTGELIYLKGHAQATFMSDGQTVEEAIHNIANNGGSGGGSNVNMSNYYTKAQIDGKGFITEDELNDSLATVAISGSYNDLTNKPIIPSIEGLASESYVQQEIARIQPDDETSDDNVSEEEKEYIDDIKIGRAHV